MGCCTEVTIFRVPKENFDSVLMLSTKIIDEINSTGTLVTDHRVYKKIGNEEEVYWQLTWVSEQAVKLTKEKWSSFTNTKALESLVGQKVYYGHFIDL